MWQWNVAGEFSWRWCLSQQDCLSSFLQNHGRFWDFCYFWDFWCLSQCHHVFCLNLSLCDDRIKGSLVSCLVPLFWWWMSSWLTVQRNQSDMTWLVHTLVALSLPLILAVMYQSESMSTHYAVITHQVVHLNEWPQVTSPVVSVHLFNMILFDVYWYDQKIHCIWWYVGESSLCFSAPQLSSTFICRDILVYSGSQVAGKAYQVTTSMRHQTSTQNNSGHDKTAIRATSKLSVTARLLIRSW